MSDERIPVAFSLDVATGDIHRRKGKDNAILEDKVIAHYNVETGAVTFANANAARVHKENVITFLAQNELPMRSWQRADLEPDQPKTKKIPDRPKKSKQEGDKTPAIVEYYHKHFPNEFATRYGVLGTYTGMVNILSPTWVPRPKDNRLEYRGEQREEKMVTNAIVATRKTHMTFLPEECVDWDEEDPEAEDMPKGPGVPTRAGKEDADE